MPPLYARAEYLYRRMSTQMRSRRHRTATAAEPSRVGLPTKEMVMSVVPQRGGPAMPADNAAGRISGYTTTRFAVLPANADRVARLRAAD
ncbi:hypothetical protein B2J96_03635 [Mycobacterium shigaense]|nr:hypothetical protein B2J96_03635 [Mycobacterium shigaense]